MQSPPSSLPRCRCKHSVSAPLFTVLGWLMQQKSSPASVLAGKHSNTVPPCGKAQEEKWSYPDLLSNSCSHCYQETITSFISAASILHKPSTHMFSFQWLFLAASFCFCIMKHCLKCHLSLKNNVILAWCWQHSVYGVHWLFCRFQQATGFSTCFDSDLFMLLHPPCPCVVVQDSADSSFPWQQRDVVCSATAGELFSSSSLKTTSCTPAAKRGETSSSILNSCKRELNWASGRMNVFSKVDMRGSTGQFHTVAEPTDSWL